MIDPNKKYYKDLTGMLWIITQRSKDFYMLTQVFNIGVNDHMDINKHDLLLIMRRWEVKPMTNLDIAIYKNIGLIN